MLKLAENAILRLAESEDLSALLGVCLQTADSGNDGSELYRLSSLVGDIYAAPYLIHEPEFAYALEIDKKIVGYVLGALDTVKFESKLQEEYWPNVKNRYKNIAGEISNADKVLLKHIAEIGFTEEDIVKKYPSHLHIDIVKSGQGKGLGKLMIKHMMEQLRTAGSTGVHLHVSSKNYRAQEFYKKLGFTTFKFGTDEEIMGINF